MTIAEILDRAERENVTLRVEDGRLSGSGRRPSSELASLIKNNRDALIAVKELERRLATGDVICYRLAAEHQDYTRQEDFWLKLIHEYESIANREAA